MELCGKKYFKYDINKKLQSQLLLKYGKNGLCHEITLPDRKHSAQRISLIKCLVGGYAIKSLLPQTRFYKLKFLDDKIKRLMKFKPSDLENRSIGEIINKLQENGAKIFLHGGIIRDIFLGVKSHDIDIIFDFNIKKIEKICKDENYPCSEIIHKAQYVNFGTEKGGSLEGANLGTTLLNPLYEHEASVNDLIYDLQNNILIDLTGFGLYDVINRLIRLSAKPDEWIKWADSDFKRPFRYFKLIEKGFKPLNNRIHNFIVNYIVDNYDTLYNSKINPNYPVKRIKHILIKTITQGDIDTEKGTYSFGPTVNKLLPFLSVLKSQLPLDIFKKIILEFNDDDLKKFKDKKLITTINKYRTQYSLVSNTKKTKTYLKNKTKKNKK